MDSHRTLNKCVIAHPAFEVADVEVTLQLLLKKAVNNIGEVVKTEYKGGKRAVFVYAADCEGNIIGM